MTYFTKVIGRPVSEAEAYARATPAQRAIWFPAGPPPGKDGAPAGVGFDGGQLARAVAAGEAAMAAGFGSPRADGLAPCGHCVPCDLGAPDRCRQPQSKAMARLRAGQAEADRLDQAEVAVVEMQRAAFAWEQAHGRLT